MLQYPMPVQNGLESYIAKVAEYCKAAPEFSGGMTVFVLGGLGRGFALGYRSWPEKWNFSVLRVPDILMLSLNPDRPFERYLKFIQQRDWAKTQGVDFFSFDGDFNHYCYWLDTGCQLIPREIQVQKGSVISLGCDCVFPVRKELRELADLHVTQTATGDFVKVTRYGRESFYASIRARPIYVSLDHLNKGFLAAVVESKELDAWLVILCEDNRAVRGVAYELWSGLLGLFDRLISELELPDADLNKRVVEICLDFSSVSVPEGAPDDRSQITIDTPALEQTSANHITIVLPENLLYLFNQPANEGELYLLNTMARGLLSLMLGCDVSQVGNRTVEEAIHKVVDGDGARILHLFSSNNQIDYLLSQKSAAPVFLAHEDFVFSKLRLSNGCVPANAKHLTTSEACIAFLEKVVDKIWTDIKRELSELNRGSVIVEMFSIHEAILKDKEHWRRTAKALIALYKNDNEGVAVANEREADRIHTSLPVRALIEMALCECPVNEGKALTNETRDTLIAKGALLIEVATESDAIYHRLAKPDIKVHPNGEYSLQKDYQQTIINPFLTNFKEEEFRSAADRYSELYEPDGTAEKRSSEDIYSEEYLSAFNAEFGLSVEDFVEAVAELFDIAIERDSVVVQSSFGDVSHRLQNERGLSFKAIEAFFKSFALWPRRHWDKAPHGFIGNDIWPWKFNRRLSLTYRPITVFGSQDQDIVVYGVGILKQGYVNLLDRISQAQLP